MGTLYKNYIAYAVFFCALFFNTAHVLNERPTNWDMLAYTWIALERSDLSEAELHAKTYETVKRHVTPETYRELIDEPTYRKKVAEDHDLFAQQVGFYYVKFAFPMLMRAAEIAGLDAVAAGRVISAASYFAIGAFLFLIIRSFCPVLIASITSAAIMTLPLFTYLGSLQTPDALSAAALLLAAYLFYVRRYQLWPAGVLILAGLIRPDNLILASCILTAAVILQSVSRYQYAAGLALIGLVYAGLHHSADYYGWSLHFYVTFVERIPAIRDFTSPLTIADYAGLYPQIIGKAAALSWTLPFAAFGLLLLARRLGNKALRNRFQWYSVMLIGLIAVLKLATFAQVHELMPHLYSVTLIGWLSAFLMLAVMGVAIVSIILFASDWAGYNKQAFDAAVLPGVMVYFFLHFTLFPAAKDRMMAGAYLFVLILLAAEIVRSGVLSTMMANVKSAYDRKISVLR